MITAGVEDRFDAMIRATVEAGSREFWLEQNALPSTGLFTRPPFSRPTGPRLEAPLPERFDR